MTMVAYACLLPSTRCLPLTLLRYLLFLILLFLFVLLLLLRLALLLLLLLLLSSPLLLLISSPATFLPPPRSHLLHTGVHKRRQPQPTLAREAAQPVKAQSECGTVALEHRERVRVHDT